MGKAKKLSRQKSALKRLEAQLESGVKPDKVTGEIVPGADPFLWGTGIKRSG